MMNFSKEKLWYDSLVKGTCNANLMKTLEKKMERTKGCICKKISPIKRMYLFEICRQIRRIAYKTVNDCLWIRCGGMIFILFESFTEVWNPIIKFWSISIIIQIWFGIETTFPWIWKVCYHGIIWIWQWALYLVFLGKQQKQECPGCRGSITSSW